MYAQDNNSLPVWIILSPAHHHISINSQPFLVGIVSTFNQIITPEHPQASFWISKPFSGFLSIATYIGRPWLIQWLPCPYHHDMDSSMQISSNGKNLRLVFIEIFDKVINKSPAVLLRCHLRWMIAWLIMKPDAHPQVIELLPWHPCQAK